jgi:hypothetical protein
MRLNAVVLVAALLLSLAPGNALAGPGGYGLPIVIPSGDVEALYAAVGNPAHANTRILLEPGTYKLSAVDANQKDRPRGGSLLLQEGMALVGGNVYADADHDGVWDATLDASPVVAGETLIDGTELAWFADVGPDGEAGTDCSGMPTGYLIPAVINYRDRALVSRLTVVAIGGFKAIADPNSGYLPPQGFEAEISDCFIDTQTFVAASFANGGCRMKDADSRVAFERNIVRGGFVGLGIFNSLTNQPSELEQGPSMHAVVRGNHILGNHAGVVSRNSEGSDGCSMSVLSTGNLYELNSTGFEATAGADVFTPTGAKGNRDELTSRHDTFRNNDIAVIGIGAWLYWSGPTASARNEVAIQLFDDRFEGGDAVHVWPVFFEPRAGIEVNNHATVLVRGASFGPGPAPRFLLIDTVPGDTNTIELVGGDTAFLKSNGTAPIHTQFLEPPHPFDLAGSSLHFEPDGGAVSVEATQLDASYGPALDYGTFPEFDDNTSWVPLPFGFKFGGTTYDSVWVNVDGNLTFGEGDPLSTPRDVYRLLNGAPRIAPFMTDLVPYPDTPPPGVVVGAIHANVLADRAIFTWDSLLWWGDFSRNTFQVTLFADGSFDMVYGDMGATDAVVGIALGGGAGPAIAVDFSAAGNVAGATIYEDFFLVKGP